MSDAPCPVFTFLGCAPSKLFWLPPSCSSQRQARVPGRLQPTLVARFHIAVTRARTSPIPPSTAQCVCVRRSESVLPSIHADPEYPCELVGTWNTWYGEQDQAGQTPTLDSAATNIAQPLKGKSTPKFSSQSVVCALTHLNGAFGVISRLWNMNGAAKSNKQMKSAEFCRPRDREGTTLAC